MTITTFTKVCSAILLLVVASSCAEDPLDKTTGKGGHTITLRLSATMSLIPETKASAIPTRSDREAEAVGFKYEMVSSDVHFTTKALTTKAPATLKNAYALLFTSAGAFNGRAVIGTYTVGTPQDVTFTNVVSPTTAGCRLVVVANDNTAATAYASNAGTGGFAGFTGTYADFQKLTLTSAVNQDIDVPYAGSATVNLSQSGIDETVAVSLSWMLAKITLNNHTFNITGGPARSSITLYNAGERRFATPGNDDYNGIGTTLTTAFVANTAGSNANSVTWYVGENIRPAGSGISSGSDRNSSKAPENACYIRVTSATQSMVNTSPKIGEEYIQSGSRSFTYDIYLGKSSVVSDFSLRRHTNYTINSEISGTLAAQEQLAASDGRVTLTKTGGESAGLAVGLFGGASGYTTGTGSPPTIAGSYTKLLLLEPNTTRTTAIDNVLKQWSSNTSTQYQTETRRHWDHTYTSSYIDKAAGLAFDYCYNLTLGGVVKGTWYLPTQAQVVMMWSVLRGLQENGSFANYSAFDANACWSSSEDDATIAWSVDFSDGDGYLLYKSNACRVRCVRDATSQSASMVTTVNGYPIIDLSALTPLGCVLSSSEAVTRRTAMYASGVTPSNDALLSVGLNVSGENGTWNAKMSTKYQVMQADHSVGGTDFANAWNTCKAYSGEGGSAGTWRLPTQRELYMIWILHSQLIGKAGFTAFFANFYWSSTEDNASYAWDVTFSNGNASSNRKPNAYKVRCVRDI